MALSEELKDVMAACYASDAVFGKVFFPDRFYRPFDPLHKEIFSLTEDKSRRQKVLASPRGTGKTSIANLLLPAKKILFSECNFVVPVSASATSAIQQSENLKRELLENEMVQKMFGDIRTRNFSKEQWVVDVAGREVVIMPRGAGQQIRGQLYRNSRPDYIVIDDLEDSEKVLSEVQREKLRKWFYSDLLNSVDRARDDWEIMFIGTVLHQDSLLINLLDSPNWYSKRLEICDDEYNSKAPNIMTDEEVKELAEEYRNDGEIDIFYREYRNLPISTQDAAFQSSYFQYYSEAEENLNADRDVESILLLDPAKTAKMESADSAVVGVGVDIKGNRFYVRDISSGKFYPDQFYDEVFSMAQRLRAVAIGVEVTGLYEYVLYPLKNEMQRRGLSFEIIELHARGGRQEPGKIARIRELVPFYRQGLMFHNRACAGKLEAQLMSFPRAKEWDVMDALGYLPEILDKGERFMLSEPGPELEMKELEREIEEEYKELGYAEDEFAPMNDFRVI